MNLAERFPTSGGRSVPCIPNSAPFTPEQRAWLNGYLAGLFAEADVAGETAEPDVPSRPAEPLLLMFGSQTGTAEQLAKRIARGASQHGFAARVMELNAFASVDFAKEQRLIIVTSTWGDGDPPDNAAAFWQHLNSDAAPKIDHLNYAVLALGDRNYANFCGAGRKFDERLEQLGAKRILPRADCDVDYEADAGAWIEKLWAGLARTGGASVPTIESPLLGRAMSDTARPASPGKAASPSRSFHRQNPFPACLVANRKLNQPGSEKETRHFEISLEGSGLNYEVGDALGVRPANCPVLVEELLAALAMKGEETVKDSNGNPATLHQALIEDYIITKPSLTLLRAAAERDPNTELPALLSPERKAELDEWLHGRDIVDVLKACPRARFPAEEFTACLSKLQPRLYSIASSPKAHPGQVHLTVAVVRYSAHGRVKKGVCSAFLADRVVDGAVVPVFVQPSHGFHLPADGGAPIIMIGPGTGIAPFRAFLEERRAVGAKGRNWLFFGDQRQACDFLYREELEAMLADGTLTRLDTAFSRDQERKIYVQHRMHEHARELWEWIEAGAHLYVCGDAKRMARDVDAALHEIIRIAGGRTAEAAAEYVGKLKSEKRYQRDVY